MGGVKLFHVGTYKCICFCNMTKNMMFLQLPFCIWKDWGVTLVHSEMLTYYIKLFYCKKSTDH